MIISLFAMKVLKIENVKLSIVMCIVISLLYIYINESNKNLEEIKV